MHNNSIKAGIIATTVKTLIAILILSLIFIPTTKNHLSAQTLDEQLQSIKDQKAATQKKIDEASKKEQTYLKQVNEADSQMLSSLAGIKDLNRQLAQTQADIDKTATDLVKKDQDLYQMNNELGQKTAILNQMVAGIYENGINSDLEVLFKSTSFIDFFSRLKLLDLIARQDAEIVKEVKDKKDATLNIKQAMLNLEAKQKQGKDDIAKLISQSKEKEAGIENIYNQKKDLLSGATTDKNALVAMEKQLESKRLQ
jgi:peptidoglycan hydrolase CwlO-like protein